MGSRDPLFNRSVRFSVSEDEAINREARKLSSEHRVRVTASDVIRTAVRDKLGLPTPVAPKPGRG